MSNSFVIFHADHGITRDQKQYIESALKESSIQDGFFIREVRIPRFFGSVPCGLYGPSMGDDPIADSQVRLEARGDRPWKDRLIDAPMREVDYVQCIGIREGGFKLFTIYGGPLAPQNPDDPSNNDAEGARAFWAKHALVG